MTTQDQPQVEAIDVAFCDDPEGWLRKEAQDEEATDSTRGDQ